MAVYYLMTNTKDPIEGEGPDKTKDVDKQYAKWVRVNHVQFSVSATQIQESDGETGSAQKFASDVHVSMSANGPWFVEYLNRGLQVNNKELGTVKIIAYEEVLDANSKATWKVKRSLELTDASILSYQLVAGERIDLALTWSAMTFCFGAGGKKKEVSITK